ncbi:MAG: hypothetical protein HOO91_19680 [Bacteroidales bacterium]|nr:hypothetical protein [Bacteroidales bacterium]
MEIGNIFPSKEQITKLKDIESVLLSRKANGKVAGWIAILSALVQFSIILWPFYKRIFDSISDKEFSSYFRDIKTFLPLCIFITCILIYLLLRRTSILLKETKEPFRYTLTVKPFQQVGKIPESTDKPTESRFSLKNQDRLLLLHHDLTELINQRIKRFLIIPIEITEEPDKKEYNRNASIIDKRQSSHIDVFGNYAIREDKENDEWIIHVMPYVRIGPLDSPATLAQSIRFSLSKDETPDILDTNEYNQLVERLYSRVTTEIYARIEKDIKDKIELFPTRYLKANALYHEARDMAKSNTINAFESAIYLYNESIRILNLTLIKGLTSIFIKMPLLRMVFIRYLFQYARIYTGHAKCLVYKYRIATLSGRKRNPIFEIRQNLKDIISDLEYFHYNISNNSEISEYKNNKRTYSILAFLTYPEDSFFRQILFRPSRPLFDETRKILFNAYVVYSLTDSLLNAFMSAKEWLDKAKAIAPDLINTDPLYILAQAYVEPNIDRAILLLQKAIEIAPSFQIAQYDLAFRMEMKFRMNDEIKFNRARSVLDEYDKVLRINPGNIAAIAAQGYIYWLLHELDEARRKFEEGYEIKAIVSETFIGQLIYGRARIFAEQGRLNECYDLFNQAFAINPNVGSYSIGNNPWMPCSFYDYMSPGLLIRYEDYYNTYNNYLNFKKFLVGTIEGKFKEQLDKNEVSDELKKALKKIEINLSYKKVTITTDKISKKWTIHSISDTLYLYFEDSKLNVYYNLEDVSKKISDAINSYILNDYGNAYYNYYRRYGGRGFLNKVVDLYAKSIESFPDNYVAKYNESLALIELNKSEDSINMLDDVIKNNPTWFEALTSLVEFNLLKINKEIQLVLNELKNKVAEKETIIEKKMKTSLSDISQIKIITKGEIKPDAIKSPQPLASKIQDESNPSMNQPQKDHPTIKDYDSESKKIETRISELENSKSNLENKKVKLNPKITNILEPTKLVSLYELFLLYGSKQKSGGNIKLTNLINNKISWIKLDEDDVRALQIYCKFYYYTYVDIDKDNKDKKQEDIIQKKLFDILLSTYFPEDFTVYLCKKELLNRSPESPKFEKDNCNKIIESFLEYLLKKDPTNFYTLSLAKDKIDSNSYYNYLEMAIQLGKYPELLKLVSDEHLNTFNLEKLERYLGIFESYTVPIDKEEMKEEMNKEMAYVYNRIGKVIANL